VTAGVTLTVEARPFCERRGYAHLATLDDHPPGRARYSLRKALRA
jgi:hypothetical protein